MLKYKYNQAKKRVTQISDLFQYHFYDLFKQEDLFQKLGLDDGELDILRDNTDKRLYIVNANNTPSSRLLFEPLHLSPKKCIIPNPDVDEKTMKKIEEICAPDLEFYEYAKKKFRKV